MSYKDYTSNLTSMQVFVLDSSVFFGSLFHWPAHGALECLCMYKECGMQVEAFDGNSIVYKYGYAPRAAVRNVTNCMTANCHIEAP